MKFNNSFKALKTMLLFSCFSSGVALQAQITTPSETFNIESSTSSVYPSGSIGTIFPNGNTGILLNGGATMRIYGSTGSLTRTLNLSSILGGAALDAKGLSSNNILLLKGTQFMVIDQTGATVTALTNTGLTNYTGGNYLKATELSNGNIAFAIFSNSSNGTWAGETFVRIFNPNGTPVTSSTSVDAMASGKPTVGTSHYSGALASSGAGTFIATYSTYVNSANGQINYYGVIFNDDGTARTWTQTSTSQRQIATAYGNSGIQIYQLSNNNFMLLTDGGNSLYSSTGAAVAGTVGSGLTTYSPIFVDRTSGSGSYGTVFTDPSIGASYDATGNYNGSGPIYGEQFNNDGSVKQPQTTIGTGYYHLVWNDDDWWYEPWTTPAVYPFTGVNGGFGVVTQNYLNNDVTYSLNSTLYNVSTPLPVTLTAFTAVPSGQTVQLSWQTAIESNSKRFIIQRSSDGVTFSPIDSVDAAGNSSTPRTYSRTDTHPFQGANYYRLDQTDLNGSEHLSPIQKVTMGDDNGTMAIVSVTNPVVAGQLQLTVNADNTMFLYDSGGKLLIRKKVMQGLNLIDVSRYPMGVYVLRVGSDNRELIIQ